jgi:hypothetical protein
MVARSRAATAGSAKFWRYFPCDDRLKGKEEASQKQLSIKQIRSTTWVYRPNKNADNQ